MKIGDRELATYGYEAGTNYLTSLDYGNGDGVQYTYDNLGRLVAETYEDGDTVTYGYDNMEISSSDANVYLIYAGLDPLSWDVGIGFTPYFAGWIGHTGYFDSSNIGKTAAIVDMLIN